MENYEEGEVKEVDEPSVFTLSPDDVNMRVAAGSKIRNLMGFAMKKIKESETRQICWSGSGKAITKTVSCAEIMKRKIKGLHQVTKIRTRRVEEYWEPKLEGLERLKVNRDIPAISILLSKDSLDHNEPGYQAPGSFDEFWTKVMEKDKVKSSEKQKGRQGDVGNKNSTRNKPESANGRKRKIQNEKTHKKKPFGERHADKQNSNTSGERGRGKNNSESTKPNSSSAHLDKKDAVLHVKNETTNSLGSNT